MQKPTRVALLALLAGTLLAPAARAAQEERSANVPSYVAVRTSTPPRVDGRADDAAWQAAPAFGAFRQRDP